MRKALLGKVRGERAVFGLGGRKSCSWCRLGEKGKQDHFFIVCEKQNRFNALRKGLLVHKWFYQKLLQAVFLQGWGVLVPGAVLQLEICLSLGTLATSVGVVWGLSCFTWRLILIIFTNLTVFFLNLVLFDIFNRLSLLLKNNWFLDILEIKSLCPNIVCHKCVNIDRSEIIKRLINR